MLWTLALIGCKEAPVVDPSVDPLVDTGSPEDPPVAEVLPASCEPAAAGPTPLETLSSAGPNGLTHIISVEIDPETGLIYAVGTGGLMSFSDASGTLTLLDQVKNTGSNEFQELAFLGESRVIVSDRDYGFQVMDVSDPSDIVKVGEEAFDDASGMDVGVYLYITTFAGHLQVRSLETGTMVSEIAGLESPWAIAVAGDWAYVADNALGLVPLDLSDPAAPVIGTPVATGGAAQDLTVDDGVAFVALGSAGVEAFDLSTPGVPMSVGTAPSSGSVVSVDASDGWLWATNHDGSLVFDVADPAAMVPFASQLTSEWALDVAANGTRAYVGDWSTLEIQVLDPAVLAPDLHAAKSELYFIDGSGSSTLALSNLGSVELEITGGLVDDDRFTLTAPSLIIESGESMDLTVHFEDDGAALDAVLCLATNDPDTPVLEVPVLSSSSGSDVAVGETAIDFVLDDVDGISHQLSSHLGSPVVLLFFSTW